MSVNGISSMTASAVTDDVSPTCLKRYFAMRNADLAQLDKDVKAGDLNAAEKEYEKMVDLGQRMIHRNNPFFMADRAMDFNAIGGALQDGDVKGAKQALDALYATFKQPPVASGDPDSAATSSVDVVG